jgi:Rad3-related DNA helicase
MRHFVLREPRAKQVSSLEYIERKVSEGFLNIVIAAPTGIGKSAIGATCCFWAQTQEVPGDNGGYYLVTQKMLQDQMQNDISRYIVPHADLLCRSIKSSSEYKCLNFGTCAYGLSRKTKCACVRDGSCAYIRARNAWSKATMSVTNYPYLFTEHQNVGRMLPRKVLVLDECHSLERQILKFAEVSLTQETLGRWTPTIKSVPGFDSVIHFSEWLLARYLPILSTRLEALAGWEPTADSPEDRKIAQEKLDLETHYGKTLQGAKLIHDDPGNWVFWQEPNRHGAMEAIAKPLDAAPFSQKLILEMGHIRVFMSAYPGSKPVFCRSLGLDPNDVAWLNLNSTFPIANRPIFLTTIGSMSRRNRSETLPAFLRFSQKILECHPDTKGIIHCNSYELGQVIYQALRSTPHGPRLIFPTSSDDRDSAFRQHKFIDEPTVIISPSMTEGFDFAEELARWQIIAKVPYPYLGDRQVAAKKEMDASWYDMEAVKSIIQACGRIVRSDTDVGQTYILDSDFLSLYDRCSHMFPRWWSDALIFPRRRTY